VFTARYGLAPYIKQVTFSLEKANASKCFGLKCWPSSESFVLECAVYASTYMAPNVHIIKITIIKIKGYNFQNQYCGYNSVKMQ